MSNLFSRSVIILFFLSLSLVGFSQRPETSRADTGSKSKNGEGALAGAPKDYKEIITSKAFTSKGFFLVHKVGEKYFFEIPDTMLGREILVVNRLSKTQVGMGYGGDQIGQNVIRFEKGPKNKIFLRTISYAVYAKDSTSSMFSSVNNSNVQPISAAFDIKAFSKDSSGSVIEITEFINGDNEVLNYSSAAKTALRIGSIQADKSYINNVRPYPMNIEINTEKTFSRSPSSPGGGAGGGGRGGSPSGNLTVEMNSSFVLLPKIPMQARHFDARVGYFTVGYTDFDANPQGVKSISLAKRWRLEPKEEDIEKYKKGELVDARKPVIFYIDPATPKKWVPYLIQGVNDWQVAFENAGFKNAIFGKKAPTKQEDSTWSLEDARNSAIVYKPSDIANASGPSIADPRSGEIMESHINWYHNVMELIRNWYLIQAATSDPRARQMVFPDELMGELIRFVSSHEVGHTLGLRHNFGSSSSVPVELLRNKTWVEANGHTPSIMDYARFNYVAQPEDNISPKGLFPRIGDYDKWAIDWGYRLFTEYKSPEAEKSHLNEWTIKKLKDHRLWWGDGETNQDDPRSQTEDLSDDAVKASGYGIKNLQRIIPQLTKWSKEDNEDYENLGAIYKQISTQFNRYMGHVSRNISGIYKTPKVVEDPGPVYQYEPKIKQVESVAFLNKQLFNTPNWLIDQDIFAKTGINPLTVIGGIQDATLNRLMSANTLSKLIDAETAVGTEAYKITDLLSDLKKGIWSELNSQQPISVYRRNLQKSYVAILNNLLNPPAINTSRGVVTFGQPVVNTDNSDITSVVRAHLVSLKRDVNAAAASNADPMSKYHLQDVSNRITKVLDPKE
jgi:Met-zincin/Domain of unknown function (DUF5117)/Domain of unknown function (DUF5118)